MASAVDDYGDDGIPEHLQCPICLELPDSEVYQCVDGHVLCKACFVKLKECPHCRRSFGVTPPIRNRHFEAQLEDLKANCPFNTNGCREKFARNALDSHKATCSYNFEKFGKFVNICKLIGFTSCEFHVNKLNTKDAVDHLVAKHGCVLTEKTAFQIELTSFDGGVSATNSKGTWTPVIAKQNNSFVLIVPLIDSKKALVWLTVLLGQLKTSEIFEIEYTLCTDSERLIYARIPLTLSEIGQNPLDNDLIFSQSPFQLSWMTLNFGESLIVDIKIRKNVKVKNERKAGNDRIVCAENIVSGLSNNPQKEANLPENPQTVIRNQPPPSAPVTVTKEELFSLARNGDLQSFKLLVIAAPQHKNIQDEFDRSLLHLTMYDPNKNVGLEKAKFLVEQMNADIFLLIKYGDSLLHFAAAYSDDKAVEYFLEKGLDINADRSLLGTPLHCACYNTKFGEANAKMLLRYNPDCTLKDSKGKNPLERALDRQMWKIANLIRQDT